MTESVDIGVLGLTVPRGTHICAFYRGAQGRDEIVVPFLAEGIRSQDKCLCILDSIDPRRAGPAGPAGRRRIVGRDRATRTGHSSQRVPALGHVLGRGHARLLAGGGRDSGRGRLRPDPGDRGDALGAEPARGRAEFFRYEAKLNEVIPNYAQVILCLYDLDRFGAEVLMDTLRTHPRVVVDGMVHENPYYIEPGKFLARHG